MCKYTVLLCNPLDAIPCEAQKLSLSHYQIEDLIGMLDNNEKCLIIYSPDKEVNTNEK